MLMSGKYAFTFVTHTPLINIKIMAIFAWKVLFKVDIFNTVVVDVTYRQNNKKCKLTYAQNAFTYFSPMTYGYAKNGKYNKVFREM